MTFIRLKKRFSDKQLEKMRVDFLSGKSRFWRVKRAKKGYKSQLPFDFTPTIQYDNEEQWDNAAYAYMLKLPSSAQKGDE